MSERIVLELDDVRKVYGTESNPVPVLHGIDFTVREGEYVAVVGPSGAGKSTLLNILGCLDWPTSGAYRLLGEDVAKLDEASLSRARRMRIGFVFQSFQLIPHITVLENVELPMFYARVPKRQRRERCHGLLDRVGLGHRLDHRPSQLSGGENQRCAVARALANDPAMVLADEPTGNLDSATSKELMQLITDLHGAGRTIVLITHDTAIAAAAPRRVTLRDGLIERDEQQNVKSDDEVTHVPA